MEDGQDDLTATMFLAYLLQKVHKNAHNKLLITLARLSNNKCNLSMNKSISQLFIDEPLKVCNGANT